MACCVHKRRVISTHNNEKYFANEGYKSSTRGATKARSWRQFYISHSIIGEDFWGFGCTLNSRRGFVILKWEGYLIFLFRLLWHIQSRPLPKIITSFVLFWCSCPQLCCKVILLNQILRMVRNKLTFLVRKTFPFYLVQFS